MRRLMVTIGLGFLSVALVASFSTFFDKILLFSALIMVITIPVLLKSKKCTVIILFAIGGLLSLICSQMVTEVIQPEIPKGKESNQIYTLQIYDIQKIKDQSAEYHVTVDSMENNLVDDFNGIFYYDYDGTFGLGDKITFEGSCYKIRGSDKYSNEMAEYYADLGISARFLMFTDPVLVSKGEMGYKPIKRLRMSLGEIFDSSLPRESAGLVKAIMLGDKSGITAEQNAVISRAGISHIFVVSGLHITMVSMLLIELLRFLRLKSRIRSVLAIVGVWAIVLLTGFNPPAIRAGIMMTVMLLSGLVSRQADGLNSLFLSGIIIVGANPDIIQSAGFLLSFTATLGILLFNKGICSRLQRVIKLESRLATYIINSFSITLSALIGTILPTIWFFKGISVLGVVLNSLILWSLPILMLCGIMLLAFSAIAPICSIFAGAVDLYITIIIIIANAFAKIPFGFIGLDYPFVSILIIAVVAMGIAAMLLIDKKRAVSVFLTVSYAFLVGTSILNMALSRGDIQIATIANDGGGAVVITQGTSGIVYSLADDGYTDVNILRYLQGKNIQVISHYIFADSESVVLDLRDSKALCGIIPIESVYMREERAEYEAIEAIMQVKGASYPISTDLSYTLSEKPKITLETSEKGRILKVDYAGTAILIADATEDLRGEKCEILIFHTQYDKIIEQIDSKYVILLKEPPLERLYNEDEILDGFSEMCEITVKADGRYKIRQEGDKWQF